MRSLFRQLAALLFLALAPALVSAAIQLKWRGDSPLEPGEVRPATARLWNGQVLWVDIRPDAQFKKGHIGRAVSLNNTNWETQLPAFFAAWSADKTVIIYDQNQEADATARMAGRLKGELKIDSVYTLKGGYDAWRQ